MCDSVGPGGKGIRPHVASRRRQVRRETSVVQYVVRNPEATRAQAGPCRAILVTPAPLAAIAGERRLKDPAQIRAPVVRNTVVSRLDGDGRNGHELSLPARSTTKGRRATTWAQRIRIDGRSHNIRPGSPFLVPLARGSVPVQAKVVQGKLPEWSECGHQGIRWSLYRAPTSFLSRDPLGFLRPAAAREAMASPIRPTAPARRTKHFARPEMHGRFARPRRPAAELPSASSPVPGSLRTTCGAGCVRAGAGALGGQVENPRAEAHLAAPGISESLAT